MRRVDSTAPLSQLLLQRLRSSTSPPPPAFWSPIAAFAPATERARAGTLGPEDAHHLFDQLLRQAIPVPQRFLNAFFAALAHAPPSGACSDGPALAVALFNRVRRQEAGPRVAPLSVHTYNILMEYGLLLSRRSPTPRACHLRPPPQVVSRHTRSLPTPSSNASATQIGQMRPGWVRTCSQASDLGSAPNAFSYSIVLKGLCDEGRTQKALHLLQMGMKQEECTSFLNVVVYNTVIHAFVKEREVSKACNLFHEMMQQGVVPHVATYNSIIGALCKDGEMDKAEVVLRQMVDKGVQPNKVTYSFMIHGYSSVGRWKEAGKMFGEMITRGLVPFTSMEDDMRMQEFLIP